MLVEEGVELGSERLAEDVRDERSGEGRHAGSIPRAKRGSNDGARTMSAQ
jgi:hypothetical protein